MTPIGLVGRLVLATRGADGPGEVLLAIRGGTERYLAFSREPLAEGLAVLVIAEHAPRAVDVEPWEDTLA